MGIVMQKPTVFIAAGGTGGHIYPALALVDKFEQDMQVVWLGTNRAVENTILADTPWPTHTIAVKPFRGALWWRLPLAFASLSWAFVQTAWYFIRARPSFVVVTGGYVGFTAGVCAALMRIPLCVCEQNQRAGWTNRLLAPLARFIFTAYPRVFTAYEAKVATFGNPLREAIIDHHKIKMQQQYIPLQQKPRILVLGGSQGAKALNTLLPIIFAQLQQSLGKPIEVWHQCGMHDVAAVAANYDEHSITAQVQPFFHDMAEVYTGVDVVVARAGALTLSELMAVGAASIIVPLPNSRDDHQLYNARYYERMGACWVMLEQELKNQKTMLAKLLLLLSSDACRKQMQRRALAQAKPTAAFDIVEKCKSLLVSMHTKLADK